jgi:hypothetical protein
VPEVISAAGGPAAEQVDAAVHDAVGAESESFETQEAAVMPIMPAPPFPSFRSTPTLSHQLPGNGFESGRDSRAR